MERFIFRFLKIGNETAFTPGRDEPKLEKLLVRHVCFFVWSLERIPRGGGGGGGGSRSARVEEEEEEEDRDKDWVRRGGGKNQTETQLETREEAHTEGGKKAIICLVGEGVV